MSIDIIGLNMNLLKIKDEVYKSIIKQREMILECFIAETGFKPSECEQVIIYNEEGISCFIRKRE